MHEYWWILTFCVFSTKHDKNVGESVFPVTIFFKPITTGGVYKGDDDQFIDFYYGGWEWGSFQENGILDHLPPDKKSIG